jgi:hypothetical protein
LKEVSYFDQLKYYNNHSPFKHNHFSYQLIKFRIKILIKLTYDFKIAM